MTAFIEEIKEENDRLIKIYGYRGAARKARMNRDQADDFLRRTFWQTALDMLTDQD